MCIRDRAYFPRADKSMEAAEILGSFVSQFYDDKPIPKLVLLSHGIEDIDLLAEALSTHAGHKVEVLVPQRGEKRALVEHAVTNAREASGRKIAESSSQARLLAGVAEAQGPAIRADVDAALAEANTAAAKLSSIADSVVTAEDPEEAVGQAMMELMAGAEAPAEGEGPPPGAAPVDAFAERIFGMLQTLRPRDQVEGSGVGLAIVNKIVESLGGKIQVESTVDHGATFWFTWPKF